jgi:hypothetical protein
VNAARSDPPTPRARAAGRAAQRREQERAARAKEKRLRRRECLEQYNKEYRLCDQQGLSSPLAPANSSSDEEDESDGGRATSDRWVLTVNSCIKVRLDLQADKSPVVVKGPFFSRVVNPRYRIRGTMCNARIQSSKAR